MKNSYLTAGIRLGPLLRLLARNSITITPKNLSRLLFLVQSGTWSSLFSRVEHARYGTVLQSIPPCQDPLFIVGHWRTGSTFLHQLLSRDPHLTAPTLFQVALPEHFLVSYAFYYPIFSGLMGKTRPMDNVRIGLNEPQEDEYALFRLTSFSPLERLIFPRDKRYFLTDAEFLPPPEKLLQYGNALHDFLTKVQYQKKKQVVSKNPFNSFRIPFLADQFPGARFIHIIRHPYQVVPSTQHLWQIVQRQNILNKNTYTPNYEEITLFLDQTINEVQHAFSLLPADKVATIKYEELEVSPLETISRLYNHFSMDFSESFREELLQFLSGMKDYKKNRYTLTSSEKKMIVRVMKNHMACYSYKQND